MGHWARITHSGKVISVVVADDEMQSWLSENLGGTWIQTSYNTWGGVHYTQERDENGERIPSADQSKALRFNYAGIGYTFDPSKGTDGAFIPPKPFDSWVLNEGTCLWEAPIPYPNDGLVYSWDEASGDWIEVAEPSA